MEGDDNDNYDGAQIAYGEIGLGHERSTAFAALPPMPNLKSGVPQIVIDTDQDTSLPR